MLSSATQTVTQSTKLIFLGGAWLQAGLTRRLERKQAGLLAYLALEGTHSRSTLAGLLWANSTESTARNNLSQTLKRIRENLGIAILGDTHLQLEPMVVDTVLLETQVFMGEYIQAAQQNTLFLAGYDFEDCPDFEEWVVQKRQNLQDLSDQACALEADRLEETDPMQALIWAELYRQRQHLSETAYTRLMRLYHRTGDQAKALQAYAQCKTMLEQEFKTVPSLQTHALLEQVQTGRLPSSVSQKITVSNSFFVARAEIMQQMQAAWAKHQAIFLVGPAGIGKTRLIQEFLSSKGQYCMFTGRPGDTSTAYSTHARTYWQMLQEFPVQLPDWVRLELSRIIPALTQASDVLTPISNEIEQLRFYQAKAEATQLAVQAGMKHIALDDLQFIDAASLEASHFVYQNHWGKPDGMKTILAYRTGELNQQTEQLLEQVIDAGLAIKIEIPALKANHIQEILNEFKLEQRFKATDLWQYTNGNPLYILETLRYSLENNTELHQAPQIKRLIQERLENLSPAAQRLAQIAAVLEQDFSLVRAAKILELSVLEVLPIHAELEQNQVLNGEVFVHDLIFEAVRQSISVAVQKFLHGRSAEILEQADLGAGAAWRIAMHYQKAGEIRRSIPLLKQAADLSGLQLRALETSHLQIQIAQAHFLLDENEDGCDALDIVVGLYNDTEGNKDFKALEQLYAQNARTPRHKGRLQLVRALSYFEAGKLDLALLATQTGLRELEANSENSGQGVFFGVQAYIYWHQGNFQLALESLERSLKILSEDRANITDLKELRKKDLDIASAYQNLAVLYSDLGQLSNSITTHEICIAMFRKNDQWYRLPLQLSNYAANLALRGLHHAAIEQLLAAQEMYQEFKDGLLSEVNILVGLSRCYQILEQYAPALKILEDNLITIERLRPNILPLAQARMASLQCCLGQLQRANEVLQMTPACDLPVFQGLIELERAYLNHILGQPNTLWLEQNSAKLGVDIQIRILLIQSQDQAPIIAMQTAQQAIETCQTRGYTGMLHSAKCRFASAALRAEQAQIALEYSTAALELPEGVSPTIPMLELYLVHAQALKANRKDNTSVIQKAYSLLMQQHATLPLEYQVSFLEHNPINKAIIEAARDAKSNSKNSK